RHRVQARVNRRMPTTPALAIQIEVALLGKRFDRPQSKSVAVAGNRPVAKACQRALERDLARSIEPARQVARAWLSLVALDHRQETSAGPGPPGRPRRRAWLWEK